MSLKYAPWGFMKVKLIELHTLMATAVQQSGECHRYTVERTSEHRVRVTYSNPDEYAVDNPITAFYPCYKGGFGAWWVVNEITKVEGDLDDCERDYAYQHFTWIGLLEMNGEFPNIKMVNPNEYDPTPDEDGYHRLVERERD